MKRTREALEAQLPPSSAVPEAVGREPIAKHCSAQAGAADSWQDSAAREVGADSSSPCRAAYKAGADDLRPSSTANEAGDDGVPLRQCRIRAQCSIGSGARRSSVGMHGSRAQRSSVDTRDSRAQAQQRCHA